MTLQIRNEKNWYGEIEMFVISLTENRVNLTHSKLDINNIYL